MIVFDLKCPNGHCFEGWFDDSDSLNEQLRKGLVCCPVCDNKDVCRMPSAFAIKSTSQPAKDYPEQRDELKQIGKKITEYVEKNFDNVGCEFATEALKIHYGVSEPRNIRGVSTDEEEKVLRKEGVKFVKIPVPAPSDSES